MSTEEPDMDELGCIVSKNARILRALESGPMHKCELADELGVAKQTIYRWFGDLSELDLVERGSDGYRLTTGGKCITETYLETAATMKAIHRCGTLLQDVPTDAVPPLEVLKEAIPVLPERHAEQVRTEFRKWVTGADVVRCMVPHVSFAFIEVVHEQLQSNEMTLKIVLSQAAEEYIKERCSETYSSFRESEASEIQVTSDLPPFGLILVDEPHREAGLIVYDDRGSVRGFMRTSCERGRQWGEDQLASCIEEHIQQQPPTEVSTD